MRVRIFYNSWFANMIVGKNITLYPFIFMMADEQTSRANRILHHEWIHVLQVRKLGFFRFYSTYIVQYVRNLLTYWSFEKAYLAISYEKEAYEGQNDVCLPEVLE